MFDNKVIEKYENLKNYLKSLDSAIIAYSAGVDSTFLLEVAHSILKDNLIAITIDSYSFPKRELEESINFCTSKNIKHLIIKTNELELEEYRKNLPNRCYYCKKEIFKKIIETAQQYNIKNILEGSNLDDSNDYRPGALAIKELNIKSPLKLANLTKEEIRILSKELNLKTANKPSFACLASRIAYQEEITKEKLLTIDKAEQFLIDLGFKQLRVRLHKDLARIEVLENDLEKLLRMRKDIIQEFKKLGFKYISMDLTGYRTGAMNEVLENK